MYQLRSIRRSGSRSVVSGFFGPFTIGLYTAYILELTNVNRDEVYMYV